MAVTFLMYVAVTLLLSAVVALSVRKMRPGRAKRAAHSAAGERYTPNPDWAMADIAIQSKQDASMVAPQMLSQAKQAAELLNGTALPDTFFPKYDYLIGRFTVLTKCQQYGVEFKGEAPDETLERLSQPDFRDKAVCTMIDRSYRRTREEIRALKTQTEKQNAARLFETSFAPYWACMSEKARRHHTEKYQAVLRYAHVGAAQ